MSIGHDRTHTHISRLLSATVRSRNKRERENKGEQMPDLQHCAAYYQYQLSLSLQAVCQPNEDTDLHTRMKVTTDSGNPL